MITNIMQDNIKLGTICKNDSEYQHFTSMSCLNVLLKPNQQKMAYKTLC